MLVFPNQKPFQLTDQQMVIEAGALCQHFNWRMVHWWGVMRNDKTHNDEHFLIIDYDGNVVAEGSGWLDFEDIRAMIIASEKYDFANRTDSCLSGWIDKWKSDREMRKYLENSARAKYLNEHGINDIKL